MPEIFLEFIGDASPWLVPLLVVLAAWGKFNWDALNNPNKRASFERAVGWLREDSFGRLYLWFLGGLMDRVGGWIGDRQKLSQAAIAAPQAKGVVHRIFGFNPFTAESYEKCLWLAFMYPVLAYLLAWAIGATGQVGDISLFESSENQLNLWQRWATIGSILLFMVAGLWFVLRWKGWKQWAALTIVFLTLAAIGKVVEAISDQHVTGLVFLIFFLVFVILFIPIYVGGWLTGLVVYRSFKEAHQEIYKLATTLSATFTVAGTGLIFAAGIEKNTNIDLSISFAILTLIIATTISGVFIFAAAAVFAGPGAAILYAFYTSTSASPSGVLAITSVVFIVTAVGCTTVIMQLLQKWSQHKGALRWFWLVYSAIVIVSGAIALAINAKPQYMLFILFWIILPLVNAPLDWLSLGFTRGLLQAVRTGNHSGWRTLIWAAADLLLAFFFLFLITAVLVGVTALGNAVAGKTLVDLGCILSNLQADMSHPDHWWIYFMLLSTLVPTLFHFALAGGAATLWLPRKWRIQLADGLENDIHKTFGAWAYLTFTPVVGFFLMPLALLGSLWWLLTLNGGALGTLLLSWAITLAEWADPSMALVCSGG
ncbi:MAG: hypothetical protein R3F02_09560 [Thiolinea sp.]